MPRKKQSQKESVPPTLPLHRAIELLWQQLARCEVIEKLRSSDPEVMKWENMTINVLHGVFGKPNGEMHGNTSQFAYCDSGEPMYSGMSDEEIQWHHQLETRRRKALLESSIEQLEILSRPDSQHEGTLVEEKSVPDAPRLMAQFSRKSLLAATDTLTRSGQSDIDRFLLEHGLENASPTTLGSRQARANQLTRYLLSDPERAGEDGRNLTDTVVEALVQRAILTCTTWPAGFNYQEFQQTYGALHRGLERDGFSIEDGQLRRALPETLDLPRADDEVHALLDTYGLTVPKGHLDQAITAHSRGDWAAANAQLRPFVESLLDEIAERLHGGTAGLPSAGHQRRQWLAQTNPPFFIGALNEWTGDGKGFIEGFYRRLHPQGSHPGLSDEDDSTFRLHLVLLVGRLLLRRLQRLRRL